MIKNPIVAFQNPITDHGRVIVKSARKAMAPALYGGTATSREPQNRGHGGRHQDGKKRPAAR